MKKCTSVAPGFRAPNRVEAIDTHKGPILVLKTLLSGSTFMRFYKEHHQFYIGIDLHARTMYVCVMDNDGDIVFYKNMAATLD